MYEKTRKRISVVEYKKSEKETETSSYQADFPIGPKFGRRHEQTLLICLGLIVAIGTRTSLSVAIVAMTSNSTSSNPNVPYYNWSNTSVILSSFFWTYLTFQVLAGHLGKVYGSKYFLLGAMCVNFTACAITPFAADKMGSMGVIMCRVIQGFSQGFLYPSVNVMLGTWAPAEERATLNNLALSGSYIGTIFASILTGYIAASWWGWTYSYYILAVLGYMWCVLWAFFGQNSPASHPYITPEERKYIQASLKQEDNVDIPTPWRKILTCLPFYAIIIAAIGNVWGYAVMMTETPTYLAKVMDFDVKSNALINALPTAVTLICGFGTGFLSDWLISNKYLSPVNTRRISHMIGAYGQGFCLIWLSYLTKDQAHLSIIVLSLGSALAAMVLVGSSVNHLDLSPRFSGILFGISNGSSQISAILAPLVAQWVITDNTNVYQWRLLFLTSSAFFFITALIYCIFASATRQPWDGPEPDERQERRKKISVISLTAV